MIKTGKHPLSSYRTTLESGVFSLVTTLVGLCSCAFFIKAEYASTRKGPILYVLSVSTTQEILRVTGAIGAISTYNNRIVVIAAFGV